MDAQWERDPRNRRIHRTEQLPENGTTSVLDTR